MRTAKTRYNNGSDSDEREIMKIIVIIVRDGGKTRKQNFAAERNTKYKRNLEIMKMKQTESKKNQMDCQIPPEAATATGSRRRSKTAHALTSQNILLRLNR
ncbi:hypothetical protein PoB_004660800 [Plakobranchus ocellatus]|uniref:Uncharacterized protein n=1 Tax=Plakobranchus ocellatus TaxID=259542 RepID=A0AAV4BLQ4_9GAST|nr:hypothetical protein PoB_004660800 [Plakobranchus ocellatus]